MIFSTRTFEQIRDAYLRDVRLSIPGARTNDRSEAWVRATAIANAILPVYANGQYLARQAFPDTADQDVGLPRYGAIYGVTKLGASLAAGSVTVTASYPLDVPANSTLINATTGATYVTTALTHIGVSLTGSVPVVATTPGVSGNADAGTVLSFQSPPPGLATTANVDSLSGGDVGWSNVRWATEILLRMRQAPLAGNTAHVIALGNAVSGVEQTFVYPALRGAGTLDVIVTVATSTGTRAAGMALVNRVIGALQVGIRTPGGQFIGGIPKDVFDNTHVSAAGETPVNLVLSFRSENRRLWNSWPPFGPGYMAAGDPTTWYTISAATQLTNFTVAVPATGTALPPVVGNTIGVFFPSKGFCSATITAVSGTGPWSLTVGAWSSAPTDLPSTLVGVAVIPWNSQLQAIAGPPNPGSLALSGAAPDYFALLGPGEMTPLTDDDVSRRRRWPRVDELNPITGAPLWPVEVTGRLKAALLRATNATDILSSATAVTPPVPLGAYIGSPPAILTLGRITVIPTT